MSIHHDAKITTVILQSAGIFISKKSFDVDFKGFICFKKICFVFDVIKWFVLCYVIILCREKRLF